jgi:hypothetical protein
METFAFGSDLEQVQNVWKEYYLTVLATIKEKGYYKPPRPLHPLRRWLLCQSHGLDYIVFANLKEHSYYIKPEVYKEVCSAYVAAFDECAIMPKKAVVIRKYLIDLLVMYAKSCHCLKGLEPQRSIVKNIDTNSQ